MRDYGIVASSFWTGETGRQLRRMGKEVQLVALYLITCPSSNMIGLYYLPLPILCHEVGISEEGALKALASLSEARFAYYDPPSEEVFLPEMAKWQVGEAMDTKDNRHKGVVRLLEKYRKSKFHQEFYAKYGGAFHLPKQGAPKGLVSPYGPVPVPDPVPGPAQGGSGGVPFEHTPEGLANAWVFYLASKKNRIKRDQPEDLVGDFSELLRLGFKPQLLLRLIESKDRDHSEYFWEFKKRLTDPKRAVPGPPPVSDEDRLARLEAQRTRAAKEAAEAVPLDLSSRKAPAHG